MSTENKFTPGPWQWQVNEKGKEVRLVALHSGTKFIMTFERWGMQSAQPRFNSGVMVTADRLAITVKGREHHADWFKSISHPDAQLIASAPDLLAALQAIAELEGDCDNQQFTLTRFQAAQIARAAIQKAKPPCTTSPQHS